MSWGVGSEVTEGLQPLLDVDGDEGCQEAQSEAHDPESVDLDSGPRWRERIGHALEQQCWAAQVGPHGLRERARELQRNRRKESVRHIRRI